MTTNDNTNNTTNTNTLDTVSDSTSDCFTIIDNGLDDDGNVLYTDEYLATRTELAKFIDMDDAAKIKYIENLRAGDMIPWDEDGNEDLGDFGIPYELAELSIMENN